MRRLSHYHRQKLERDIPESEPDIDHERQARIEAEARHVTEENQ